MTKNIISSLFLALSISLTAQAQLPGSKTKPFIKPDETKTAFGAEVNTTQKAVTVDEAITLFKDNKKQPVLLEAKIDKVCQKKGCWMTVKSSTRDMRVIFKDYGFFVPVSLAGKTVLTEGVVTEKKLTLEETKHFVKDEGGDPAKVTEPITDYQFVASGVQIKK